MLSDEEKKTIQIVEDIAFVRGIRQDVDGELEDLKAIEDVLRLVDKQSKEIEHWKAGMKIIEKDKNNHIERLERKIKELDSQNEILEEIKASYEKKTDKLLKEKVKRQKEIEELKIQNNKLAQCHFKYEEMTGVDLLLPDKLEYTSNDKIKAKIEEYKWAVESYDCGEADYKQSQAVGAWNALRLLLKESEI